LRQAAETGDVAQSLDALLNLEVPEILLHDVGHGHAQRGRKILGRHGLLLFRVLQKLHQAIG